jgi:hypothetical protein
VFDALAPEQVAQLNDILDAILPRLGPNALAGIPR